MPLKNLQDRIYQAQCYGNVEPIEHMVPYPNLAALIEGQNIKHADQILYEDINMTNAAFYRQVKKTANWLAQSGVNSQDRVLLTDFSFPDAEILAFGIWTLGAGLVLAGNNDLDRAIPASKPKMIIRGAEHLYPDCIRSINEEFIPDAKPLLREEALVFWHNGKGIRLSHYNLLVNANGLQRRLDLHERASFQISLTPDSIAWVVLQAILPLFTGARLTSNNPEIVIGLPDQFDNANYIVDFDWINIGPYDPPHLFVLPEAGGILSIGESPLHMTGLITDQAGKLMIQGHSVMLGYLNDENNQKVFKDGKLIIERVPG